GRRPAGGTGRSGSGGPERCRPWLTRGSAQARPPAARQIKAVPHLVDSLATAGALLWRALGKDTLQRTPVHVETASGFRNVAIAELIHALDMFPPHTIGRHRVFGRGWLVVRWSQQRVGHFVSIGRLCQIVYGTKLHGGNCRRNIAIAGQHDATSVRADAGQFSDYIQTVAVIKPHID